MYCFESEVVFDSKEKAKSFFESIQPEFSEEFLRSKSTIKLSKEKVCASISATDKSAMRASLNSFTKPLFLFKKLEAIK